MLLGGSGPLVFDPGGYFRGFIGRHGSGPGEYQRPGRVVSLGGDTVLVLDNGNNRATIARINGEILVSHPFTSRGFHTVLRLSDTTLLVNAIIGEPARVGFPLHTTRLDGVPLASFGAEDDNPRFRAGQTAWQRRLASGTGGWFWVADRFRYVVDRYDAENRRHEVRIVRTPDWFRVSPSGYRSPSTTEPGSSFIAGLHQSSDSVLWVVSVVADPNWRRGLGLRASDSPSGRDEPPDLRRLHDSVVEALDLRTWRVLARTRIEQYVAEVTEHGYLITYEETDDGVVLEIFTLSLARPAGSGR